MSSGADPKPRRVALPFEDADDVEPVSAPARRATSPRRFRLGLVALVVGAVASSGLGLAAFAASAQASDGKDVTAVVEPFNRQSDASRSDQRPALDGAELADAVNARSQSLTQLDKEVAATTAEAAAADREKTLSGTSASITTEDKRLQTEKNLLVFPAEGKPGSPWGMRLHPILGYYRMHWGTDIGAACGSPLRAVYDGVVTVAAYDGGSGNHVKIDHGTFRGKNLVTDSLHMTNYIVKVGDKVKKGQIIGYTGSTGLSTECHLHFETFWGGQNVDPVPLLNAP